MNMLKQLLNLFFICLILTTITACTPQNQNNEDLLDKIKTRGYIIAGVKYDARPFGFVDQDQELKGFDIDLLKEITKRLLGDKNKIEFRQVTSATRIPELTSSNIDVVAATMTINEKRKMVINFIKDDCNR